MTQLSAPTGYRGWFAPEPEAKIAIDGLTRYTKSVNKENNMSNKLGTLKDLAGIVAVLLASLAMLYV